MDLSHKLQQILEAYLSHQTSSMSTSDIVDITDPVYTPSPFQNLTMKPIHFTKSYKLNGTQQIIEKEYSGSILVHHQHLFN